MRNELDHDYKQYLKYKSDKPLFHRVKFNSASIYLTKATYFDNGIPETGRTLQGDYRVFSWTDYRAKAFLGFELGQDSPTFGEAELIGAFSPSDGDLKDIKYQTGKGKAYYKSAKSELENWNNSNQKHYKEEHEESPKIDASNFMKMSEIIPTGAQGKAIYGEGNYIIDGPAGTGKSTTVLQKIKLLQLHHNIESDDICIIVKNKQIIDSFSELLSSIDIVGINIFTEDEFLDIFCKDLQNITNENLIELYSSVSDFIGAFEQVTDINILTAISFSGDNFVPAHLFGDDLYKEFQIFISKCEEIRHKRIELDKEIYRWKKDLTEDSARFKRTQERLKKTSKRKSERRRLGYEPKVVQLNLKDEATIRDEVAKYTRKEQAEIDNKRKDRQDNINLLVKQLETCKESLTESFIKPSHLVSALGYTGPEVLLSRYVNKYYKHLGGFHTIIIDEAQDVKSVSMELIRLQADNTILAGDESQHENSDGIGSWQNILFKEKEFSINGKLNLYQLRHNFRQTFELGSVSYNYRQLILSKKIEDIKSDYFDDQIGFSKPRLKYVCGSNDFLNLVKEKITHIKRSYTESFPLVIFYENDKSLTRFRSIIENDVTVKIDEYSDSKCDVLFVPVSGIAGREFPVVIAPLANGTSKQTIYVMLSRAKFDLTLVTGINRKLDPFIQELYTANMIIG